MAAHRTRPTPDPRCRSSRIQTRTSRSKAGTAASARRRSPRPRARATLQRGWWRAGTADPDARRIDASRHFDGAERIHLELDDFGWERGVAKVGRKLLARRERPLHEVHDYLRLRLVLGVLVEEK